MRHGLHYNENATVPGAQTERRGEAGPMRTLLALYIMVSVNTCDVITAKSGSPL